MISLLSSAIPGVDTVVNANAMTGGVDAESDAAFKVRFGNYLASLSRATNISIYSTIEAVQQGLSYSVTENLDQSGNVQLGHFVVTVDDGTGAPPVTLLQTVQQAVDAIRPVGTSFAVQGPVVVRANIAVTLTTASGANHAAAIAAVTGAIEAFIAALPIGAVLSYTKLAQLAYEASSSVVNLSGLLLNGETTDLMPPLFGVVRAGVVTVS
jgi:phage-related baseplate assembly protein